MFDVMEIVKDAQGRTLKTITKGQDRVLKTVKVSADRVGTYLPDLSGYLPVATYLPAPKVFVDNGFDFAKKLLDTNKRFAVKLVDAAAPVTERIYGPATNGTKA